MSPKVLASESLPLALEWLPPALPRLRSTRERRKASALSLPVLQPAALLRQLAFVELAVPGRCRQAYSAVTIWRQPRFPKRRVVADRGDCFDGCLFAVIMKTWVQEAVPDPQAVSESRVLEPVSEQELGLLGGETKRQGSGFPSLSRRE